MSKPNGNRVGHFVIAVFICLVSPQVASAQYTAEEKKEAIDAVTAYLEEVGEGEAAKTWVKNWASANYSFGVIEFDADVVAGSSRITFNEEMIRQLRKGAQFGGPKRKTIGDWAATFKHELVHTRQLKVAWTASLASQAAGEGHPLEAEAWGEGFKAYWKWLRRATAKYAKARTYEEKQKYAKEVIDLAESFKSYDSNYRHPDAKLGPLPEGLRFEPLDGREDSDPLRFAEALREAGKISKELSPTLHLAVRLSKSVLKVKPGEPMTLHARPENVWSPSSKKSNSVTFTWKAGSKRLAETSGTLVRTATVDETITVIAQDDRSQKAEASCQVIVEKPEVAANPVPQAPEPKTAPKAPAPAPAAKTPSPAQKGSKVEYAWVHTDTRPNDWQTKLDRQNASTPAWRVNVSASAGSVTIKNTYIGKRPDAWMKNGMSESGTVTWTPPSRVDDSSGGRRLGEPDLAERAARSQQLLRHRQHQGPALSPRQGRQASRQPGRLFQGRERPGSPRVRLPTGKPDEGAAQPDRFAQVRRRLYRGGPDEHLRQRLGRQPVGADRIRLRVETALNATTTARRSSTRIQNGDAA